MIYREDEEEKKLKTEDKLNIEVRNCISASQLNSEK